MGEAVVDDLVRLASLKIGFIKPISRAASRTRSSKTRSPSSAISSIAARSAPIRAPATAPASWCRSRTSSSPRKAAELGFKLPQPGEYAVGDLFMPRDTNGGRSSATSMPR